MKINLLLLLFVALPGLAFSQNPCNSNINNNNDVIFGISTNYSSISPDCNGTPSEVNLGKIGNGEELNFDIDVTVATNMLIDFNGNNGKINIPINVTVTINGDLTFQQGNQATLIVDGTLIVKGNFNANSNKTFQGSGLIRVDGNLQNNNENSDCPNPCSLSFQIASNRCSASSAPICEDITAFNQLLPVTLLHFSAKQQASAGVQISWATTSETQNDYFSVERSADGRDWEVLRQVPGAGNSSSVKQYAIFDDNPFPLNTYYRLKQTDFDGTFAYSQAVQVQTGESFTMEVFPNPVSATLNLKAGFALDGAHMQLFDMQGKVHWQQTVPTNTGWKTATPVANLPEGLYVLECLTPQGQKLSQKILIQH